MPLSKTRQIGNVYHADQPLPVERDLKIYEVFTRKNHGAPHIHAGAVHAPNLASAVELAREHYGQDEVCVHIWVVDRENLAGTERSECPINKLIEHSYRYARDYQGIRSMWKRFRDDAGLKEYEKEDLKEAY